MQLEKEMLATANAIRTKGSTETAIPWKKDTGFEEAVLAIKGGADLNFEVVGSLTEPETPAENTIWVDTPEEITAWVISGSAPETPAPGTVWIVTNSQGKKVNILEKGEIVITPSYTVQFNGSAWENKNSYLYQHSGWTGLKNILYILNDGIVNTEAAGTFVDVSTTVTMANGVITTTQSDTNGNFCYFNKPIYLDGENYKTIHFSINTTYCTHGLLYCGVHTEPPKPAIACTTQGDKMAAHIKDGSVQKHVISVDLSSLDTGSYYVQVIAVASFTIDKIWLD